MTPEQKADEFMLQRLDIGMTNENVVKRIDAMKAVEIALIAERERISGLCDAFLEKLREQWAHNDSEGKWIIIKHHISLIKGDKA